MTLFCDWYWMFIVLLLLLLFLRGIDFTSCECVMTCWGVYDVVIDWIDLFLSLSLSLSLSLCSELASGTLSSNSIEDGTEIRLVPAVESGVTVCVCLQYAHDCACVCGCGCAMERERGRERETERERQRQRESKREKEQWANENKHDYVSERGHRYLLELKGGGVLIVWLGWVSTFLIVGVYKCACACLVSLCLRVMSVHWVCSCSLRE